MDNFSALMGEAFAGKELDPNAFAQLAFQYLNQSQQLALQNQNAEEEKQYNRTRQETLDQRTAERQDLSDEITILTTYNDMIKDMPLSGITPDLSGIVTKTDVGTQIKNNMIQSNQMLTSVTSNINNNYQNYLAAENVETKKQALEEMSLGLNMLKADSAQYKDAHNKYKTAIEKENLMASIEVLKDGISTLGDFHGVPQQVVSTALNRIEQAGGAGNFELAQKIYNDVIKTGGGNLQGKRDLDKANIQLIGQLVTNLDKIDDSFAVTEGNRQGFNQMFNQMLSSFLSTSDIAAKDEGDTAAQILRTDEYRNIYSEGKLVTLPNDANLGSGGIIPAGTQIFAYIDKNGGNNMVTINPDGTPNFSNIIKFNDDSQYDALQGIRL
tara:strand:- start:3216 stop:4364 length:1149 start_codon:yes stop_codon:yes gene_type:complete